MHKTVSVSIGNTLFVIEETAYAALDKYLRSVRAHFAGTPDSDEIVSDIEDRMAEEFSGKLSARKKVILQKDVDDLIRMMGTVEDFEKFEGATTEKASAHEDQGKKQNGTGSSFKRTRIYRDADDQVLGGVCAGIAKYFDIDPLIVRLAFGLSLFLGGFGIVLYILLWVILPEARTTTEKVEMTGGRVTLAAIQQRIDEKLPPEKRRNVIQKIVAIPVMVLKKVLRAIGKLFSIVGPLIGRLIGTVIIIAMALAIAGITTVLVTLLLNPASPYIGIPLQQIVGSVSYFALLFSGYIAILFPLILLVVLGASLSARRSAFSWQATVAMGTIWLVALVMGGVTAFSAAPSIETAVRQYRTEHAEQVTRTEALSGFSRIDIGSDMDVIVSQSGTYAVSLQGTADDLRTSAVTVKEGTLVVDRNSANGTHCIFFCERQRPTLQVRMPQLTAVRTGGIASAEIDGFSASALQLTADGASRIQATVHVSQLTTDSNGIARIVVRGSGTVLHAQADGNSRIDALLYPVKDAQVSLNGISRVLVNALSSITGDADGNSTLSHTGQPTVHVNTSGIAHVEQLDDTDSGDGNW